MEVGISTLAATARKFLLPPIHTPISALIAFHASGGIHH